jgi:hypothetical protein
MTASTLTTSRTALPALDRATRLVAVAAMLSVVLVGVGLSGLFVTSALRSVGLAWPVTHPEGVTISAILRVRDGQPLYQDFRRYPYVITPYAPLQPVLAGLASRLLHLTALETIGLTRSLTLAASLTATVLIWLVAWRSGASRLAALAGASLFLALPFLDEWGFAARPDLPALALSLLAMLFLLLRPGQVWLAALVAVLALFTKQTAVALPAAAMIWLLLGRRWRAAAVFAAIGIGVTAVVLGLLELITGGTYALNTVLAQAMTPRNGFDMASRDLLPLFADGWLPVGLAALAVAGLAFRRERSLPALYLLTSVAIALVALRNTGSDVNYLIEPSAAACILASVTIDRLWSLNRGHQWAHLGATLVLSMATVIWGSGLWDFWRLDGGVQPIRRLPIDEIAAADAVLSEEPLAILLAGRPLVLPDMFHASQLITSGLLDVRDLERQIKRGDFDLIVMRSDVSAARRWKRQLLVPEAVRLAIKDTYVPAGRVGMFWLYRPEGRRSPTP